MIKYIYREVMELINDWKSYLTSIWNLVDLTSLILNLDYIVNIWEIADLEQISKERRQHINTIGAFACFLMWIKTFFWMKMFSNTSYFLS